MQLGGGAALTETGGDPGAGEPDAELREIAGLPDTAAGRAMLAALDDVVWSKRLAAA